MRTASRCATDFAASPCFSTSQAAIVQTARSSFIAPRTDGEIRGSTGGWRCDRVQIGQSRSVSPGIRHGAGEQLGDGTPDVQPSEIFVEAVALESAASRDL